MLPTAQPDGLFHDAEEEFEDSDGEEDAETAHGAIPVPEAEARPAEEAEEEGQEASSSLEEEEEEEEEEGEKEECSGGQECIEQGDDLPEGGLWSGWEKRTDMKCAHGCAPTPCPNFAMCGSGDLDWHMDCHGGRCLLCDVNLGENLTFRAAAAAGSPPGRKRRRGGMAHRPAVVAAHAGGGGEAGGPDGGGGSRLEEDPRKEEEESVEEEEEEDTCCVCLERFPDCKLPQCGHYLCGRCARRMLLVETAMGCPLCRGPKLPPAWTAERRAKGHYKR